MLAHLLSKRTTTILPRFLAARTMSSFGDHCPLLLSPAQLRLIQHEDVAVLDASWHMPNVPRNAKEEFVAKHLPKARFLDLDEVASPHDLGLKHMMPPPELFAEYCGASVSTPNNLILTKIVSVQARLALLRLHMWCCKYTSYAYKVRLQFPGCAGTIRTGYSRPLALSSCSARSATTAPAY